MAPNLEGPDNYGKLIHLLTDLREEEAVIEVKRLLDSGDDPLNIVEACQAGMRHVGENYEEGRYYISGLIMGGEILRQVLELLQPFLEKHAELSTSGTILLGTVQGDIHDLGKNLFMMLLRSYGLHVIDLGVDVSPDEFLIKTIELRPDIVAMSALLSGTYISMQQVVELLKKEIPDDLQRPKTIIGGGNIDQKIKEFVGSDLWAPDAMSGVRICREYIGEKYAPD